jgi:hypothetical protein
LSCDLYLKNPFPFQGETLYCGHTDTETTHSQNPWTNFHFPQLKESFFEGLTMFFGNTLLKGLRVCPLFFDQLNEFK